MLSSRITFGQRMCDSGGQRNFGNPKPNMKEEISVQDVARVLRYFGCDLPRTMEDADGQLLDWLRSNFPENPKWESFVLLVPKRNFPLEIGGLTLLNLFDGDIIMEMSEFSYNMSGRWVLDDGFIAIGNPYSEPRFVIKGTDDFLLEPTSLFVPMGEKSEYQKMTTCFYKSIANCLHSAAELTEILCCWDDSQEKAEFCAKVDLAIKERLLQSPLGNP